MFKLLIFLLISSLSAQLTSVTPTTGTTDTIIDSGTSSYAPVGPGIRVYADGSGTFTVTPTCGLYGWESATLPTYIYLIATKFPAPTNGQTCDFTIEGTSGGSQIVTLTINGIPRWDKTNVTDANGNHLTSYGTCSKSEPYFWYPNSCDVLEATSRPGGTFTPPATYGATRTDATFGGIVRVYPDVSTSRSAWLQISHQQANGLYYWANVDIGDPANPPQLMAINTTSSASNYTNIDTLCGAGSNGGIWLDPNYAKRTKGYCLIDAGTATPDVIQFDFSTPPNATSDGVVHTHVGAMGGAIGLGNPVTNDGWFAHHDTAGQICMTNIYDAEDVDYCFTPSIAYYPRSLSVGQIKSNTTGLYYINSASDAGSPPGSTNRNSMWSFSAPPPYGTGTGTFAEVGNELPRGSVFPQASGQYGRWYPGICPDISVCQIAGHSGMYSANGEPWVAGHGRFQVIYPPWNAGTGGSIKAWLNTNVESLKLVEQGGGALAYLANYGDYYIAAGNSPVQAVVGIGGGVDQGVIPAWQITTASCTAGACVANVNGNLSSSTWTIGTEVFIDGFSDANMNGVKTLTAITATTFSWTDGSLTSTPTSNTASVTQNVSRNSGMVKGGLAICRMDIYHCRTLSKSLAISYGTGSVSGASGSWVSPFNALVFITVSPYGEYLCYNSNYGYTINQWGNCIATGFDLDLNTQPHHFDRHGRGLYIANANVATTTASGQIKTSNPAYTCVSQVSTRSDFGTQVTGSPFTATGSGSTKALAITGLSSGTRYYVNASCGQSSTRVMEYARTIITTK